MPVYDSPSEEVVASEAEIASLSGRIQALEKSVLAERVPKYATRLNNLRQFKKMILDNMDLITSALYADLNQSDPTPHLTDCLGEVDFMISNLSALMQPQSLTSEISFVNFPASAQLVPEPLGTVLVLGTWNFPFHAALGPVPGALAAGNRVVVKPGSLARNSSRVIGELISTYFLQADLICVEGGPEIITPLLNNFSWGHVFFTGSTRMGKIVMTAAAKNLTPVTLELGGKSPCIVTASADVALAARRVAWGKWTMNAGQVCIAPDHVIVHSSIADEFVDELRKCVISISESFCQIISKSHVNRLERILLHDRQYTAELPSLQAGANPLVVQPQLLDFKSDWAAFTASACMEEEIFGPILPLVRYTEMTQVEEYLKTFKTGRSQTPLAFYIFTKKDYSLVSSIAAGAVVVNDTGMHIAETCLPFGGVGASGMGAYHGKRTFDLLTHYKPVLYKSGWFDIPFRYPPFSVLGKRIVQFLLFLGRKNITPLRVGKVLLVVVLAYKLLMR